MSARALAAALVAGALFAGCEQESIDVSSQYEQGAQLFNERCSGCHTIDVASAQGSKPEGQRSGGERTNGPNFNTRHVKRDDVLFAIRNGGFSGAIMPANVVVGEDAEAVASFLDKYSGGESSSDSGGSSGN